MGEATPKPPRGHRNERSLQQKLLRRAKTSASRLNVPYPVRGSNVEGSRIFSIDWDIPEFEVSPEDPRWILPESFDLGAHDWYQELPEQQKIEIGMKRIANVTRTGLEFEQALVSGIAHRNQILTHPRHYSELRQMGHEATEEQQHILMFNEMISRIGVRTYGAPKWFRNFVTPLTGPAARKLPVAFYASVLAGEEPIDHMQQTLIEMVDTGKAEIHPMVYTVMDKHIREEAGHIGAADDLLDEYVPRMSEGEQKVFAKLYPVLTRIGINAIMVPSRETLQYMGVPEGVAKEVWFDSDYGRQNLQDMSFRARRRAERLGLRDDELLGKVGRKIWQMSGVDGPTTRTERRRS